MRFVLRRRRLQRLVVTLKSGAAFDGVLWTHDREAWVLRHAVLLHGQADRTPVDGEVVLLVKDIDYTQRP